MLNENIQNRIKQIARECITEQIIKRLIKEEVKKLVTNEINEYVNRKYSSCLNESDDIEIKRNAVMKLLKDEKFKDSELAYSIWPDMDKDTARSLFSKMASGKPDRDGVVRHFSDEDVSSLYELLRSK